MQTAPARNRDPLGRGIEEVLPTVPFRNLPLENLSYFKPPLIWESERAFPTGKAPLALDIYSRSINIVCGQDAPTNLRVSLKIAIDIARAPRKKRNSSALIQEGICVAADGRIVAPDDRSVLETYDLSKKPDPSVSANVLYINTLAAEWAVNNEMLGLWPELDRWALESQEGKQAPRPCQWLPLHVMSAEPGDLLQYQEKLFDIMHEQNINVVVLNSFEMAWRTERQKRDLMLLLRSFQHSHRTVIVFTHESAAKLQPGKSSRALGGLAIVAQEVAELLPMDATSLDFATPGSLGYDKRKNSRMQVQLAFDMLETYARAAGYRLVAEEDDPPPDDPQLSDQLVRSP